MSSSTYFRLKDCVSILPKSDILAGESIPDGRYPFFLSGKKIGRINQALYDEDAIVMGDGGVANIAFATGQYSFSSHNFAFKSNSQNISTNFLFHALENFLPTIDYKGFVGSGIKNIDKDFLFNLYIEIPPLREQKKVASILGSVDRVIKDTELYINKLRDLRKATTNELLTKGIDHTTFRNSELGRIPKSWEVKCIKDIGAVITGSTPSTNNRSYYEGNIMFVSPADITDEMLVQRTIKHISEDGLRQTREIPKGSIMVVCVGSSIGKVAITSKACATNQQINTIIPKNNDLHFVYFLIKHSSAEIRRNAGTQAVPLLNKTDFSNFPIRVPPLREQQIIGRYLNSIDSLISRNVAKLYQTQSLKESLMQCLLTGKVKVN